MVSDQKASLSASPRKKNKALPKLAPRLKDATSSSTAPEENAENGTEDVGQGAIAGPSSPTRRRRRPSVSRRRSSSISAAASLISSYSTSAPHHDAQDAQQDGRKNVKESWVCACMAGEHNRTQDSSDDEARSFFGGKASPYHMALVTVMFSLASDMPLASQFKVYTYMMCQIHQVKNKGFLLRYASEYISSWHSAYNLTDIHTTRIPPAPELPSDPVCNDVWVEDATSTYAAAMATVGALISLVLLNRCSVLSERFGRKPLLLLTHILLASSTLVFKLSVLLPTYVGAAVLYVAVVILEASAGAPLRIAIQNYVVDTTVASQRAAALSFTDGFGQIGAFPSSTIGGWLSAVTQNFFAPFYASIASYVVAMTYILLFVPESKKRHRHTLIDDFEHFSTQDAAPPAQRQSSYAQSEEASSEPGTESNSGGHRMDQRKSRMQKIINRYNFLAPLSVFIPRRRVNRFDLHAKGCVDWRIFNLAIIVLLEESFQVFLIPILLLYNSRVFGYDVVQNGYLVSLLQGVRALYLTVIFPRAITKLRDLFAWLRSKTPASLTHANQSASAGEAAPLLGCYQRGGSGWQGVCEERIKAEQRIERGRLDIIIMCLSYLLCTASFFLLSTTHNWLHDDKENHVHASSTLSFPSWAGLALSIIGIQLGAGATSLRTALLVNAVSEQEDEAEEVRALRSEQWHAHLHGTSATLQRHKRTIHHERHQSKALAANQILCTAIYALVPLLTSRIFGMGLEANRPELVWLFKGAIAALSAAATVVLFLNWSINARHAQKVQAHRSTYT